MRPYLITVLFLSIFATQRIFSQSIELIRVGSGFDQPTEISSIPGNDTDLIVLEKTGKAKLLNLQTGSVRTVIDLSKIVLTSSEQGLLGIAFANDYSKSGKIYLNFIMKRNSEDRTIIAEINQDIFRSTEPILEVDNILKEIAQPYANHNGGCIRMGKDGFLYIGLGDGGSSNDPHGNGQNSKTFLGKLLRIDPKLGKGGMQYQIPKDNPFYKSKEFYPEIYAYGFRNPWKFSFDRETHELFLADVGQNRIEEVNVVRKAGNYGWNIFEGNECFKGNSKCKDLKGAIQPIHTYNHDLGQSITGGYVYRGTTIPSFQGHYVFGDFVSGTIWSLSYQKGKMTDKMLLKTKMNISTFGEDNFGELYLADFSKGEVYKLQNAKKTLK
ncbi:PQQ-dependent sugar dehydrogenase [Leptospira sp. GIMC2001]|uniref:PQQ-dependent sugar dehydrogenase n=1 Tax=Leptospira sp. GIMC2001 TaxID=1513297 RepID=UPI00234A5BDD|nr:PQQ-dependent sugar dehydrogenase [Leptospira sp. GIMC2001]WCL50916.1 PQQ-dependent sugar dehydrogenase [Leptospira sp. GIMC2001]